MGLTERKSQKKHFGNKWTFSKHWNVYIRVVMKNIPIIAVMHVRFNVTPKLLNNDFFMNAS